MKEPRLKVDVYTVVSEAVCQGVSAFEDGTLVSDWKFDGSRVAPWD